jgi:hypothetical protein
MRRDDPENDPFSLRLTIPLRHADPAVQNRILERLLLVSWLPRRVRDAILRHLGREPSKEKDIEAQWREMRLRVVLEQYKRQRVKAPLAKLAKDVGVKTYALEKMLSPDRSKLTPEQRLLAKELAGRKLTKREIT